MAGFNMDDYVPVNERIEAFYKKHPDGSLQSEIVEHTEARVTVKAYAYRDREDTRPGTGLSSETIPGSSPFTKGSEVENAETSAWGRAIAALGFEVKRGIASREEMRRQQPQDGERSTTRRRVVHDSAMTRPAASPAPANKGEALDQYASTLAAHGMTFAQGEALARKLGIDRGKASVEEIVDLIAAIEQPSREAADGEAASDLSPGTGAPPKPGTPEYEAAIRDEVPA